MDKAKATKEPVSKIKNEDDSRYWASNPTAARAEQDRIAREWLEKRTKK